MGTGGMAGGSGRRASLNLRQDAGASAVDALDAANQSLSDALRITLRLVWAAMVVLLVLFVLSGVQTVREGQRAISLLFGKVQQKDLAPGPHFVAPYPLGELLKIDTGVVEMEVDAGFWPQVGEGADRNDVSKLTAAGKLDPIANGSLITADQNVVHARFRVQFSRSDTTEWAGNVDPTAERAMVEALVSRAVVRSVAHVGIDDLLKQSGSGESGAVARRARESAQAQLDELQTGIVLTRLEMIQAIPPRTLADKFANFLSAAATSGKAREEAEADAKRTMTAMAGDAVGVLSELIDRYDLAVRNKDEAGGAAILGQIDAIMEGRATEVDGKPVQAAVSGTVTQILADAQRYRSEVVNQRRNELLAFTTRLEQYRLNPAVTLHAAWADGVSTYLNQPRTQVHFLPPNTTTMVLRMNRDPSVQREVQQDLDRLKGEEQKQRRMDELMRNEHSSSPGGGSASAR